MYGKIKTKLSGKLLMVSAGLVGIALLSNINLNIGFKADYRLLLNPSMITTQFKLLGNHYDINLGESVGSPDQIQPVLTLIQNAGSHDVIVFHIKGYGGSVDGLITLVNVIKESKAKVIMSVEGNSYSADAALATSGSELRMSGIAFLMFHMGTINGTDCSLATEGNGDGISPVTSCQDNTKAIRAQLTQMILDNKILTPSEKAIILAGGEFYVYYKQVHDRLKELNK